MIIEVGFLFIVISIFITMFNKIPKDYIYVFESNKKYSVTSSYIVDVPLKENTIYKVEGDLSNLGKATVLGGFDSKNYYSSKNIYYYMSNTKAQEIIEFKLLNNVTNYVKTLGLNEKEENYINTLILGKNKIDDETNKVYQNISISHLFSVSGFHIVLYVHIISGILEKFLKEKNVKRIVILVLGFLIIISSFKISIIRASMIFLAKYVFDFFKIKKSNLEVLSIVLLVILFINSNLVYDKGFILSFLCSFIILISKKLNKSIFTTSLIILLATLPITISMNGSVSVFSVLYNVFYITFFSLLFIPVAILRFIGVDLWGLFNSMISFVETSTEQLDNLDFNFYFKSMHIILVFIYYYLLYFIFKNKENNKYDYISIVSIIILITSNNITSFEKVIIFDVGQGSSALIYSNNKASLIDVGGNLYKDVPKKYILPYMRFSNIRNVDIYLSHMDFDHIGGYDSIKDQLIINNTYLSVFSDQKDNFINVKHLNIYDRKDNIMVLYPDKFYEKSNDKSMVLLFTFSNGETILFPGDSELDDFYMKVDYLVLSHHGASNGFSQKILDNTSFKEGLISVGKNNKYGHPSRSVINLLNDNNKLYYLTSRDNSIYLINVFGKVITLTQKDIEFLYGYY